MNFALLIQQHFPLVEERLYSSLVSLEFYVLFAVFDSFCPFSSFAFAVFSPPPPLSLGLSLISFAHASDRYSYYTCSSLCTHASVYNN